MKKVILILLATLTFISCSKDDEVIIEEITVDEINVDEVIIDEIALSAIIGKWKLIERLADPGDGNGVYISVDDDKILEFFDNGTITSINGSISNGYLCSPSYEDEINSGIFSLVENKIIPNCQGTNLTTIGIGFQNDHLILSYPSIEGLYEKFQKVE